MDVKPVDELDFFDTYQVKCRDTAVFPEAHKLTYPVLGLVNETAEMLEKYLDTKVVNDESVIDEVGDVFWYMAAVADTADIKLSEVFRELKTDTWNEIDSFMFTCGSIAGIVKKAVRDKNGEVSKDKLLFQLRKLAVLMTWVCSNLIPANATESENANGISVEAVMDRNISKLADRKKRGVIKGSGDKR